MAYVTKKDKQKIINYSNDLLNALAESFRYQNCDNFIEYQRRYYGLKLLFQSFIESL